MNHYSLLLLLFPLVVISYPLMGWDHVPIFAHIRWANLTHSDLINLSRFRSVTVQVEPDAPIPCEAQASDIQAKLATVNSTTKTLMYGNVHFGEPNCAYFKALSENPWMWLNDSSGKPVMPAGRYCWDWSIPGVPEWYVDHVIMAPGVEGGFGDSGCGDLGPAYWNTSRQQAYAAGQREAHALATSKLAGLADPGTYIANCPILPKNGDPPMPGVNGEMLEEWCSDFNPGGSGPAAWCRAELIEAVVLGHGAGAVNQTFMQAHTHLAAVNGRNPQFGLAAFLIAAWPGAFFGASTNWEWAGDFENLLNWPWASLPLGEPRTPPTMSDPSGCAWTRVYANATSEVNLCAKHLFARISWVPAGEVVWAGVEEVGEVVPMPSLLMGGGGSGTAGVVVREVGVGEACIPGVEAEVGAPWASTGSGRACLRKRAL